MKTHFTDLTEHTVIAALNSEDDDHPIVAEVARLVHELQLAVAAKGLDGGAIAGLLTPTAATSPIERVAMDILAQSFEEEGY